MLVWLTQIITLARIVAFVLGSIVTLIAFMVVDRKRAKAGKAKSSTAYVNVVVGTVIIVTMFFIMVSTQQARNCAINLNISVAREQSAAKIERDSFQTAITESLALPPEILALPQNDPVRKAATDPITNQYLTALAQANKMRADNQSLNEAARKACGV